MGDPTPALARAAKAVHDDECGCEYDGDHPDETIARWGAAARGAVSAALHDPDGALVEAVVPTLDNYWCGDHYDYQVTDDDGEPLQCCAKARLEQARRMFNALSAAILGEQG